MFMIPRRTYMPGIIVLACSEAEIEPVPENMNLSYLAQYHSSVTRLIQLIYIYQMYNTTGF